MLTPEAVPADGSLRPSIVAFLARRQVAHLATADAAGRPHVVPVCFALVGPTVYVAIDAKPKRATSPYALRRVRNLQVNPHASLVADVYDHADWTRLGFVLLEGDTQLLEPKGITTADAEHAVALVALRGRYAQYRAMQLEQSLLIALRVQRVVTWGRLDG